MTTIRRAMATSTATPMYQLPNSIKYCNADGRVVLLDLRNGKYILLDAVASNMWNLLVSMNDRSECINQLASQYGVSTVRCELDLEAFAVSCTKQGFFCNSSTSSEQPHVEAARYCRPSLLNAWKAIFRTKCALAKVGFPAVYKDQYQLRKPPNITGKQGQLDSALATFCRAENFFSVRDARVDCLPRSLALHRFLLLAGLDAYHCIGVRRFPFAAHAWVQVASEPICDSREFVQQFVEITRI